MQNRKFQYITIVTIKSNYKNRFDVKQKYQYDVHLERISNLKLRNLWKVFNTKIIIPNFCIQYYIFHKYLIHTFKL